MHTVRKMVMNALLYTTVYAEVGWLWSILTVVDVQVFVSQS